MQNENVLKSEREFNNSHLTEKYYAKYVKYETSECELILLLWNFFTNTVFSDYTFLINKKYIFC